MRKFSDPIAVLGAGSWGTALAVHLARNNPLVRLWGRNKKQVEAMGSRRCNTHYLPEIALPSNLSLYHDIASALEGVEIIVLVAPSHAFRDLLLAAQPHLTPTARLIWATKGIDPNRHTLLHEVVQGMVGERPLAVLGGPSFAREVAMGLPTAVTVAASNPQFAAELTSRFHSKTFRVYTSTDIIGVEVGGAVKNVLALAVGIADGLGFGANTRSALITRGLNEMVTLGLALGGKLETFMGLAGLGDLILTCTDDQSRNRRLGLALGKGIKQATAEQEIGQVVEGVRTAQELHYLAQRYKVELPISEEVYQVLYAQRSPKQAVENLLSRKPKAEGLFHSN